MRRDAGEESETRRGDGLAWRGRPHAGGLGLPGRRHAQGRRPVAKGVGRNERRRRARTGQHRGADSARRRPARGVEACACARGGQRVARNGGQRLRKSLETSAVLFRQTFNAFSRRTAVGPRLGLASARRSEKGRRLFQAAGERGRGDALRRKSAILAGEEDAAAKSIVLRLSCQISAGAEVTRRLSSCLLAPRDGATGASKQLAPQQAQIMKKRR